MNPGNALDFAIPKIGGSKPPLFTQKEGKSKKNFSSTYVENLNFPFGLRNSHRLSLCPAASGQCCDDSDDSDADQDSSDRNNEHRSPSGGSGNR